MRPRIGEDKWTKHHQYRYVTRKEGHLIVVVIEQFKRGTWGAIAVSTDKPTTITSILGSHAHRDVGVASTLKELKKIVECFLETWSVPEQCPCVEFPHPDIQTVDGETLMNLIDVDARAKKHPNTFLVPSITARKRVLVGDQVKIGDNDTPTGERFWVVVTERNTFVGEGPRFVGRVLNETVTPNAPRKGDIVKFQPMHILEIYTFDGV